MAFSTADIIKLQMTLKGPVFKPGSAEFDQERAGFNLCVQQRPALIVSATCADDVAAAVRFAARHEMPVSVLATGHGPTGWAEGSLMISTRRMDGLSVDPEARTARVEAGVRWQEVIEATAKHGLAGLVGSSPTLGVTSYTLGGGLGPLGRAYGWAADKVRSLDLVTATGRQLTVTPDEHPELFWALRGGKGNFGVVTAMEFGLVPVATLYGGTIFFDGAHADEVLHAYRAWTETVPDQMTSSIALLRLPPMPDVPPPLQGRLTVAVRIAYVGTPADGEHLVAPLRAVANSLIDTVDEIAYADIATVHMDPTQPMPAFERTTALGVLDADAVDAILDLAGPDSDCSLVMVEIRHLGGALARQPRHPNAVGNRDAAFTCFAVTMGGPEQAVRIEAALDEVVQALEPWSTGGRLVNFVGAHAPVEDYAAAWDGPTYERLRLVKTMHDPNNVFRINANVQPL
ncbi:FAD-binding oxidoreductase [Luteipulveratus mongoliensis]|uniref:FAD-binding PCMH-type domain-containing protein n=1 Tax=Luteipulveratus mongoliensis TaxID=571913 RepID=A0A0K1JDC6_9MICO|nr:FAD-binding oxidoreductase [Luteipulveratus mongoliensis]AKU14696.1 hypothetical protein VV02_00430 [Luteipulveratus mongoliensis]